MVTVYYLGLSFDFYPWKTGRAHTTAHIHTKAAAATGETPASTSEAALPTSVAEAEGEARGRLFYAWAGLKWYKFCGVHLASFGARSLHCVTTLHGFIPIVAVSSGPLGYSAGGRACGTCVGRSAD